MGSTGSAFTRSSGPRRSAASTDNDKDKVDLQVGMYAEPLPPGFGFSDTAFRAFILMASRRLKSDRFFTPTSGPRSIRRPASTG
jgi:Animal haem peroxidase